jgi:hypothetical protein
MSTLKLVNLQHPSSTNVNVTLDTNGGIQGITLTSTPFYRNSPNVTSNVVIGANYNEMSIGPITINDTITANVVGEWVIL